MSGESVHMAKKKTAGQETTASTPDPSAPRLRRGTARRTPAISTPLPVAPAATPDAIDTAPDRGYATPNSGFGTRESETAPERAPSYEEIAEVAYHRYLRRGASDGHDFDDWVEAERELRSRR